MKTVIDAVNEFKGVWPYDEPSIIEQISTENFGSWHEKNDHALNTGNFRIVCTKEEFNQCVEEMMDMSIKPVFTQEFKVRGGTNCDPVWQPCKIVFKGKRYTVVENESGKEFSRKTAKIIIRDIDTRTDEEKAIDDMITRYRIGVSDNAVKDACSCMLNEIKAGKIHGVTWSKDNGPN